MIYRHDVFISYRRQLLWTPWTRDHFKVLLTAYLQQELGAPPDVFVDERIEVGADWVDELGTHLACSKAMVAILSRDYFGSPWCLHELDLMLERSLGAQPLIVPVIVQDCDNLSPPIGRVQSADFKDYRLTHMSRDGLTYEQFSAAIKRLAPTLASTISGAPPFDATWADGCKRRFGEVYMEQQAGRTLAPTQFVTPPTALFTSLPQLIP